MPRRFASARESQPWTDAEFAGHPDTIKHDENERSREDDEGHAREALLVPRDIVIGNIAYRNIRHCEMHDSPLGVHYAALRARFSILDPGRTSGAVARGVL